MTASTVFNVIQALTAKELDILYKEYLKVIPINDLHRVKPIKKSKEEIQKTAIAQQKDKLLAKQFKKK